MAAGYWEIGRRIVEFEQGGKGRAAYGEAPIERLAGDLTQRFGRGFSQQNLWQMRQFYLCWPIPQALSKELHKTKIPQAVSGESKEAPCAFTPVPRGLFSLAIIRAMRIMNPCNSSSSNPRSSCPICRIT